MKRCLVLTLSFLLLLTLFGCAKQETGETDTGAAGQPEEMADTTRLDSAAGMDLTTEMDSAAEPTEDSAGSEESGEN